MWWPDIDKQIEECAKASSVYRSNKSAPSRAPLHSWQWPSSEDPFGFCGASRWKNVVASHRCTFEVAQSGGNEQYIECNNHHCVERFLLDLGLPQQIVTDNRPQFTANEFRQLTASNGVKHITTSPYHPSSNGAAERMVQTVKRAIRVGLQCGDTLEHALASFLFAIMLFHMRLLAPLQVHCSWADLCVHVWIC